LKQVAQDFVIGTLQTRAIHLDLTEKITGKENWVVISVTGIQMRHLAQQWCYSKKLSAI